MADISTFDVNGEQSGLAVTKSDVGLGNVVNTGDSATPVEGGTTKFTTGGAYTELAKKVDTTRKVNGHALSADVTVSKSDVGLGSVVNTGDSATPTSGGTTKFTTGGAYTELAKKAPTDHSSTATTYGVATAIKYGHVKLSGTLQIIDQANVSDLQLNYTDLPYIYNAEKAHFLHITNSSAVPVSYITINLKSGMGNTEYDSYLGTIRANFTVEDQQSKGITILLPCPFRGKFVLN